MKIQEIFGTDFWVPWFMKSERFNYFVSNKKKAKKKKNVKKSKCKAKKSSKKNDSEISDNMKAKDLKEKLEEESSEEDNPGDETIINCAICICPLNEDSGIEFEERVSVKPNVKRLKRLTNGSKVMRTPCDHYFHIPCLINWMERKMECPNCRKELPYY